jgi:hypothetical protein
MDTKLRGDIAEQAIILQALNMSWGVLRPIGDRLPFVSFAGTVSLPVLAGRQRDSKLSKFRNAWNLIQEWALPGETQVRISVKIGEAGDLVIPSQASQEEGVET